MTPAAQLAEVKSSAYPGLERKKGGPDNWVEAVGGLPSYIERIAKHLHYEEGMTISRAIATAVSRVKVWAAGGGGVKPATKAKAARAVAQWEAKKAKAGKKRLSEAEIVLPWPAEPDFDLAESRRNLPELALIEAHRGTRSGPTPTVNGTPDPKTRTAQLQRRLTALGHSLKDDGQFGPVTDKAVREFQQQRGLKVDGLVGPKTTAALRGMAPEPSGEPSGDATGSIGQDPSDGSAPADGSGEGGRKVASTDGEETPGRVPVRSAGPGKVLLKGMGVGTPRTDPAVREMQAHLGMAGQKIVVDGRFGPATEKAVKRFQRTWGLKEDGIVGPKTSRTLRGVSKKIEEARASKADGSPGKCASCGKGIPKGIKSKMKRCPHCGKAAKTDADVIEEAVTNVGAYTRRGMRGKLVRVGGYRRLFDDEGIPVDLDVPGDVRLSIRKAAAAGGPVDDDGFPVGAEVPGYVRAAKRGVDRENVEKLRQQSTPAPPASPGTAKRPYGNLGPYVVLQNDGKGNWSPIVGAKTPEAARKKAKLYPGQKMIADNSPGAAPETDTWDAKAEFAKSGPTMPPPPKSPGTVDFHDTGERQQTVSAERARAEAERATEIERAQAAYRAQAARREAARPQAEDYEDTPEDFGRFVTDLTRWANAPSISQIGPWQDRFSSETRHQAYVRKLIRPTNDGYGWGSVEGYKAVDLHDPEVRGGIVTDWQKVEPVPETGADRRRRKIADKVSTSSPSRHVGLDRAWVAKYAKPLPEPKTLFHGSKGDFLGGKEGDEVTLTRAISSSGNSGIAGSFGHDTIYHFDAPAGTKTFRPSDINGVFAAEDEHVLLKNTRARIERKETDADGRTHVYLSITRSGGRRLRESAEDPLDLGIVEWLMEAADMCRVDLVALTEAAVPGLDPEELAKGAGSNAGFEAMVAKVMAAGIPVAQARAIVAKGLAAGGKAAGAKVGGAKRGTRGGKAKARRMPDGTFAQLGQGQILEPGRGGPATSPGPAVSFASAGAPPKKTKQEIDAMVASISDPKLKKAATAAAKQLKKSAPDGAKSGAAVTPEQAAEVGKAGKAAGAPKSKLAAAQSGKGRAHAGGVRSFSADAAIKNYRTMHGKDPSPAQIAKLRKREADEAIKAPAKKSPGTEGPKPAPKSGNVGGALAQVRNGKTASMSQKRKQDLVTRGFAKWDGPGEISLTDKGQQTLDELRPPKAKKSAAKKLPKDTRTEDQKWADIDKANPGMNDALAGFDNSGFFAKSEQLEKLTKDELAKVAKDHPDKQTREIAQSQLDMIASGLGDSDFGPKRPTSPQAGQLDKVLAGKFPSKPSWEGGGSWPDEKPDAPKSPGALDDDDPLDVRASDGLDSSERARIGDSLQSLGMGDLAEKIESGKATDEDFEQAEIALSDRWGEYLEDVDADEEEGGEPINAPEDAHFAAAALDYIAQARKSLQAKPDAPKSPGTASPEQEYADIQKQFFSPSWNKLSPQREDELRSRAMELEDEMGVPNSQRITDDEGNLRGRGEVDPYEPPAPKSPGTGKGEQATSKKPKARKKNWKAVVNPMGDDAPWDANKPPAPKSPGADRDGNDRDALVKHYSALYQPDPTGTHKPGDSVDVRQANSKMTGAKGFKGKGIYLGYDPETKKHKALAQLDGQWADVWMQRPTKPRGPKAPPSPPDKWTETDEKALARLDKRMKQPSFENLSYNERSKILSRRSRLLMKRADYGGAT